MLSKSQFDECVRRALVWIGEQAERAQREGVPLSESEAAIARQAGVREVERVRLLPVAAMPSPQDSFLQSAMQATGFWLDGAAGLTLGHAILLLDLACGSADSASTWREQGLIAHELAHVAQVERLGLEEFLREYLEQCLRVGYDNAPLEREARAFRFGCDSSAA